MKLLITIHKEVKDKDDARDTYNQITEALEHINPELEIQGRISAKLEMQTRITQDVPIEE